MSKFKYSIKVLTIALLYEWLARSCKGDLKSYTISITSRYLLFQSTMLTCEKYPQSRGNIYCSLPRRDWNASMKKGRCVVGSIFIKQLTTHVVFVSIIMTVSRGSLYFLESESVYWGGSVMYLMIYLGISKELVIYSRTLGWKAFSVYIN